DTVLEKKEPHEDSMAVIVKAFKRCVWKRVIVDHCPPDLTFYLAFQKHVAAFAWITVVADDVGDATPRTSHGTHASPHELPFPTHSPDEHEFYDFFHKFGHLHYVAPRQHLIGSVLQHAMLPDVHRPFAPTLLVVHDPHRLVSLDQWHAVADAFRWTVLDYPTLLEHHVVREAQTGQWLYTPFVRTGERVPHDLVVRLLAQAIAASASHHRFLAVHVPDHMASEVGLALLDAGTRAAPPSQLLYLGHAPLHRAFANATTFSAFEQRSHAVGRLVYEWLDGVVADVAHLRAIFHRILAPVVVCFMDEGNSGRLEDSVTHTRGYATLSVKDVLRAEVLKATPDGAAIHDLVQTNEPIPDDLIVRALTPYCFHKHHRRLVVADFPRSIEQARAFVAAVASPTLLVRSQAAATPFGLDCLPELALATNIVSVGSPATLRSQLTRVAASVVLGDVDELDVARLQRHFQRDGVHVLPLAHVESSVRAMHPAEPVDDETFARLVLQLVRDRGLSQVVFLGFPRTLGEAKAFGELGVACARVVFLHKKIIPVPHEPTDEDYYSSDEEEKARKRNAPEPQMSQLARYFGETRAAATTETTFVDVNRVYPVLTQQLGRPSIVLAVGNKASGFHAALQRAAHSSHCVYLHVPTLLLQHVDRFPTSDRAVRIQAAWAARRLVDPAISIDLIKSAFLRTTAPRIVITGYPRVIGNSMPYVHDQVAMLVDHVGPVTQLLHFTCTPETLLARVGTIEAVQMHSDAFHEESAYVVDFCTQLKTPVTVVRADSPLDVLTQDIQTLFLSP
ncbi:hypothetical protein As57867_015821, partial [Aphanomyces stellatus]